MVVRLFVYTITVSFYCYEFNNSVEADGLNSVFHPDMRKVFLLLLLCIAGYVVSAQAILAGYIKDSLTHLPIAGATVSNPAKKKKVQTDGKGFFSLPVSPNEVAYALAPNYRYDTLRYSTLFQDTITIYLVPINVLQGVTVEASYQKYQSDSIERRRDFEKSRGRKLNTVDRSSHKDYFGLTINLDRLFKRKERDKHKSDESFALLEQAEYVRHRFSPQLVAFYTGLKGDELMAFMQRYTPSYEWLREHLLKEQMIDYLSEKLVAYRKDLRQL